MKRIAVLMSLLFLGIMSNSAFASTVTISQQSLTSPGYEVDGIASSSYPYIYIGRRDIGSDAFIFRAFAKFNLSTFYALDPTIGADNIISVTFNVIQYTSGNVPIDVYAVMNDGTTPSASSIKDWNKLGLQTGNILYSDYFNGFSAIVTESVVNDVTVNKSVTSLLLTTSDESTNGIVRFDTSSAYATYLEIEYTLPQSTSVPEPVSLYLLGISLIASLRYVKQ